MPIALTCPKCNAPLTVPDADAGKTVRCATCRAEFPADAVAPLMPPPEGARRRVLPWVIGLVLLGGAGVVAYLALGRSTPTDFAHDAHMFSARFPNPPEGRVVSEGNALALKWGEHLYRAKADGKEYSVSVLDSVNAGDQPYGPASRDTQINEAVVILLANDDGQKLADRPATHEGHPGREVVFVHREDGKLTALRVLAGEHHILRLAVTGSGNKDKATDFLDKAGEFFNGVKVGEAFGPPITADPPTVSATDLNAAYKTDAKAADEKFKDKWVRVTGSVKTVSEDRALFEINAGPGVVEVRRAPPGRRTVFVQPDEAVAVTGKCRGLGSSDAGTRVVLDDAIVANPAPPK